MSLQLRTKATKRLEKLVMLSIWKLLNAGRAQFWQRKSEFSPVKKHLILHLLGKKYKNPNTGLHLLFQTKKILSIGSHGLSSKMCPSGLKIYNKLHLQ